MPWNRLAIRRCYRRWKFPLLALGVMLLVLVFNLVLHVPKAQAGQASVNKSFSPLAINPGQVSTLTVTFFNSNTFPLTNAAVTDNLPTGMVVATPPNITNGCGGTVTAAAGSTSFNIANAGVPAKVGAIDGQCSFSVQVTTTVQGNSVNTIPANTFTNTEGQTNANPASATLQVRSMTAPSVSKALAPNTIIAGDRSTLTLTLRNNDTGITLTNVGITDNLPAQLSTVGTATTTCGGTVNATGATLTLVGGSINPNSTCTITVSVTSNTVGGPYANTIPVGGITSAQGVTNGSSATAQLTVQARSMTVGKTFSPTPQFINQNSTLTITLANPTSLTTYTNASVTDVLPAGLTANGAATSNCGGTAIVTGQTLSFSGGTINPGATCTITVPVTASTANTYTNTILANAATSDQSTASNTISTPITFNPLRVNGTKAFSPTSVNVNGTSTLTITLTNPTAANYTGLTFTDPLPAGMTITSGPTTTCALGSLTTSTPTAITLTGASLSAGASCTVTATVQATSAGTLTNTIPINNVNTDQGARNVAAISGNLTVNNVGTAGAPLTGTKSFNPTGVSLNSNNPTSLASIVLTNNASITLTNVSFTDPLPANLVVATPVSTSNTCGGTVAQAGGAPLAGGETSFRFTGGTIAAGGTCTITIRVRPTTVGDKTNTIGASAVTSNEGNTNTASFSSPLRVASGDVTVAKSFTPTSVTVGQATMARITITNPNNSGQLTGLSITDTLPSGLVVAPSPANPAPTTNCTSGTVTAAAGSTTITLTGATLNQNANCRIDVYVVPTTAPVGGSLTNTIPANSIANNQGRTNANPASANLSVVGVALSKAFFPTTIAPNGRSVLRVTITNYAPFNLTNVQVVDPLPQSPAAQAIQVATAPNNATTTCAGGTVTAPGGATSINLTGATVPAAVGGVPGLCTFEVEVTGTASSGSITNTIPLGTANFSSTEGLTTQAAATAILNFSPLSLQVNKDFSPLTVSGGSTSVLTVQLNNPTAVNYIGVQFTDNMPAGMSIATPPNATTTCTGGTVSATAGAGSFSLSSAQLAANSSCTVSVSVTSNLAGNLTNTIPIGGVTSFQGASNTQPASATLTNLPGLGASKAFTPSTIPTNGVSTLVITITNADTSPTTNIIFTDNFPPGLVVASPANASTTCGGTVTTTTNSLALTNGALAANSSCTVSANVTANTQNSYFNNIAPGDVTGSGGKANVQAASATLQVANVPTVSKSFNPTSIIPGGTSTLTIQLGNTTGAVATLTSSLVDTLPTNITLANPPAIAGTCTTANVTAAAGGSTITYASGSTIPVGGCTIIVNVTGTLPGTYTNTILAGALQTNRGNNSSAATANLTIAGSPNLLLVKRITRINGTDQVTLVDGPGTADNDPNWPTNFLRGAIDGGVVRPGDQVEYTIYFLSNGGVAATNVQLCDLIPANSTFLPTAFNGQTPSDGGLPSDQGIAFSLGSSNPTAYLTNIVDAPDRGQFVAANTTAPRSCNPPLFNTPLPGASNPRGAVVVDVAIAPASLPPATAPGTPANSYGFVRFRASIN